MKKIVLFLTCLLAIDICAAQQIPQTDKPVQDATQQQSQSTLDRWMDKASEKVKEWEQNPPQLSEEARKYADEIKEQWPNVKEQFNKELTEAKSKGVESKDALTDWFDRTFSKEHVSAAEDWLKRFKSGVEDKVIDPLVPYLLSLRYSNPMDEWNQGYRRLFPVQIKNLDRPLEITLPLSWAISQNMSIGNETLISWRNESGDGKDVINLIETPNGTTVESIIAGLLRERPNTKYETLPGTKIVRINYEALGPNQNAMYYYAIPIEDTAFLLCTEVENTKGKTPEEINSELASLQDFYDLVAKNIFVKP